MKNINDDSDFSKLEEYLADRKNIINAALKSYIPAKYSTNIWEAMEYSLLAGGKRLRPVLTIAVADVLDFDINNVLPAATAIEMLHTHSLIHDDLPAMDNDALRRGKPTNHVVYGEAIAILTGDALQALAFNIISRHTPASIPGQYILKVIEEISHAVGADGMCGGQAMDITLEREPEGISINEETLKFIHVHKTGALIRASVRCGAILAGAETLHLKHLTDYSENIGLAFQIVDDVLDETAATEELGKTAGKDKNSNKLTYPRLFGIERSMEMAKEYVLLANESLEPFGSKAEYLKLLAAYTLNRIY